MFFGKKGILRGLHYISRETKNLQKQTATDDRMHILRGFEVHVDITTLIVDSRLCLPYIKALLFFVCCQNNDERLVHFVQGWTDYECFGYVIFCVHVALMQIYPSGSVYPSAML